MDFAADKHKRFNNSEGSLLFFIGKKKYFPIFKPTQFHTDVMSAGEVFIQEDYI